MTSTAARMLETHPADLQRVDSELLLACIEECLRCAQACTACADACLHEDSVADLRECIRTNQDCADICLTTATVLSRHTGRGADLIKVVLSACEAACRSCAAECEKHAGHHEHCKVCAEACRACEAACQQLLAVIG